MTGGVKMLSRILEEELNRQINEELFSAYLYFAMSAHFEAENWKGFASWLRIQAIEELGHADRFYKFVIERGGRVELQSIEKPTKEWKNALSVFEDGLKHERHITERINHLMDIAIKEKDYASQSILKWFVDEQVEEEANFSEIVAKLKMIEDSPRALFYLDHELAKRAK
jgi:ferritin